jgi:hypothetical protein
VELEKETARGRKFRAHGDVQDLPGVKGAHGDFQQGVEAGEVHGGTGVFDDVRQVEADFVLDGDALGEVGDHGEVRGVRCEVRTAGAGAVTSSAWPHSSPVPRQWGQLKELSGVMPGKMPRPWQAWHLRRKSLPRRGEGCEGPCGRPLDSRGDAVTRREFFMKPSVIRCARRELCAVPLIQRIPHQNRGFSGSASTPKRSGAFLRGSVFGEHSLVGVLCSSLSAVLEEILDAVPGDEGGAAVAAPIGGAAHLEEGATLDKIDDEFAAAHKGATEIGSADVKFDAARGEERAEDFSEGIGAANGLGVVQPVQVILQAGGEDAQLAAHRVLSSNVPEPLKAPLIDIGLEVAVGVVEAGGGDVTAGGF